MNWELAEWMMVDTARRPMYTASASCTLEAWKKYQCR